MRLRILLCAAAGALALAGCTDGGADSDADGSADRTGAEPTAADPCRLLTAAEVTEHLRGKPAKSTKDEPQGRPTCVWRTDDDAHSIRLMLWRPPAPDIQRDNQTLDVAGHPGYVSTSGETFCLVDIELDDTWIQLETKTPPPDDPLPDDAECQRVADLAGLAIERLG